MGTVAISSIMTTSGIIDMNIPTIIDSGAEQFIFFQVKSGLVLNEDITDLSTGNVDPPFAQLLQDQRLGNTLMIVLINDIALEGDTKVATFQLLWERTRYCFAIGRFIACESIMGIVGLNQQVLDGVILIGVGA